MSRADLARKACTVARAIEIVGDEWTLMLLREMFLGGRRFDDLERQTGAAPHVLSRRLKRLETVGVLRRCMYSAHPPRYEYRLTAKGRGLWPVVIALKVWGDRWLDNDGTPVEIVHKDCGRTVIPHVTCPDCGKPMQAHDALTRLSPDFELERNAAGRQT